MTLAASATFDLTAIIVAIIYGISNISIAIYSANKAKTAKNIAQDVQGTVQDVAHSVGPSNGKTLRDLLKEIRTFQKYQHKRNHDVINMLMVLRYIDGEVAKKMDITVPEFDYARYQTSDIGDDIDVEGVESEIVESEIVESSLPPLPDE